MPQDGVRRRWRGTAGAWRVEAGDGADADVAQLAADGAEQEGGEAGDAVHQGRVVLDGEVVALRVGGDGGVGIAGAVVLVGDEEDGQPGPGAQEAGVGVGQPIW